MASKTKRVSGGTILRTLGSLISLGLLIYLIARQGWREILASFSEIPVTFLLVAIGLMVISRASISLRWYALIRSVNPDFSYIESLRLTLAGLFAANFLPTTVGGDVVRAAGVLRRSEHRMDAVTSIAADRLVGLLGMAMLVPFGLVETWDWFLAQSQRAMNPGGVHSLSAAGFFGSEIVQRFMARLKRGFYSLAAWARRPRALLTALGFTWIHQLCLFTNVWLFLNGMNDPLGWWSIASLWSLSYFITLMPFSIGGLGIRELSITFIYQEIGGISVESALTLAVLLRGLDILASIPGAFFLPTILSTLRSEESL
ncbi:MAG: lysylphosphatidylglycerol synthase transmembrane domain-containing protein [Anaerolineales bacterium]|nr:lysylphosphatidylglycerol synthase transmembrane domain-containing protein [Anaerolineales bacterium]